MSYGDSPGSPPGPDGPAAPARPAASALPMGHGTPPTPDGPDTPDTPDTPDGPPGRPRARPYWGPRDDGHGAPSRGAPAYGGPPYGAPACAGPGRRAGDGAPPDWPGAAPSAYLRWAIAATIGGVLFCLIGGVPTGLASVYFARQVTARWQAGDQQGARSASRKARAWAIVSTVADVLGFVFAVYLISSGATPTVG